MYKVIVYDLNAENMQRELKEELEMFLNDGWQIERCDSSPVTISISNSGGVSSRKPIFIYILKKEVS